MSKKLNTQTAMSMYEDELDIRDDIQFDEENFYEKKDIENDIWWKARNQRDQEEGTDYAVFNPNEVWHNYEYYIHRDNPPVTLLAW